MAEHLCVAAGDIDMLPGIRHTTGEAFPAWNVLHLIEEKVRLLTRQFSCGCDQIVKILQRKFGKTLILEVHIDDPVPVHAFCDQIPHDFIKQC